MDRLQNLNSVIPFHLALSDAWMKYLLTASPEVPHLQLERLREQAMVLYDKINLTAAREFQRHQESGADRAEELGIEGMVMY